MTPEVAVVITCRELGATMPDAVASVHAQTVAPREIVVVDDGSTGARTLAVLAALESGAGGVRVLRSELRGPAHARNLGIAATSSPLVVLLDGDDLFAPEYLERASTLLAEREDLSFVCCALTAFGRASYRWKPPPYTIAEALGRGACGHISTVFRREVWELLGGFDETLPAYEDVDFWLRALAAEMRGAILDEALLRYRVRRGSRYHAAIVRGDYVNSKRMLLDKHRDAAQRHGEDVFATMIDFGRELKQHRRALHAEIATVATQVREVEQEVLRTREELTARGIEPLDFGELDALGADGPGIEAELVAAALEELSPGPPPVRTRTIGPGAQWPEGNRPLHDLIVVTGALEREDDPDAALARCRAALRRGGRLVVTVSAAARGGALRGFTESSLLALLCRHFPVESVRVSSRGNLMTCIGAAAGAGAQALPAGVLEADDPVHPTIIAGCARVPGGRRSRRIEPALAPPPRRHPRRRVPGRGVILAYHRVASLHPDTHRICTPPEEFTAQMALIARLHQPIALRDLAELAGADALPADAVSVTFDDGYLDNLEVAAPILAEFGIPATFFVCGDVDGEPREAWWDEVERVLLAEEPLPERLALGAAGIELPTATEPQRVAALLALHGRLLAAAPGERAAVVAALAEWGGIELEPRPSRRLMTSDELVDLAALPGLEVGAHGLHHRLLTDLPYDERANELAASRADLQGILGRSVDLLAYPYGDCDVVTTQIAGEAGFAIACSVEGDPVTADSDPLRLPRIEIGAGGLERFAARIEALLAVHG